MNSDSMVFSEELFFDSSDTFIHPTAVIGKEVKLDYGVKIGPYAIIFGDVNIGKGTVIHSHVVVGGPAQNLGTKKPLGNIVIKQNCQIREFATVHASKYEDGKTIIGNNCYIMNYCHISHDNTLEDNVTLINGVNLGGHTHIEKYATIMANSATHQFCRVGTLTALAPFSGIRQDLPPYCLFTGRPAHFSGLNITGLKRAGLSGESISAIKFVARMFYHEKKPLELIKIKVIENSLNKYEEVSNFLLFIENSSRGVSRNTILMSDKEKQVDYA